MDRLKVAMEATLPCPYCEKAHPIIIETMWKAQNGTGMVYLTILCSIQQETWDQRLDTLLSTSHDE